MQPLNPFLSAFFKSQVVAQCTPVHHHILLVPLTDVLLTHRETESGAPAHEVVASEEFLASHVLRIAGPDGPVGAKDSTQNLREARGKARQFNTLNGRSVIVKDSFIYSNKGILLAKLYPSPSRNTANLNRRRVQVSRAGPDPQRHHLVPRCLRTSTMARILHLEASCWNVGRDQARACGSRLRHQEPRGCGATAKEADQRRLSRQCLAAQEGY